MMYEISYFIRSHYKGTQLYLGFIQVLVGSVWAESSEFWPGLHESSLVIFASLLIKLHHNFVMAMEVDTNTVVVFQAAWCVDTEQINFSFIGGILRTDWVLVSFRYDFLLISCLGMLWHMLPNLLKRHWDVLRKILLTLKVKSGSGNGLVPLGDKQGWGKYYSGTRLAQNDKHEYTKSIVREYYSSTNFPVLILVCSVLTPALVTSHYLKKCWQDL